MNCPAKTHLPSRYLVHTIAIDRSPGRVSPNKSLPLPDPRVSYNTTLAQSRFSPLPWKDKEPQQMRPSSICSKPRPAGPQAPEITPCTVASSSLALSTSGLVRIQTTPNDWPVRVDRWAAGDFVSFFPPVLAPSFPRKNTTGVGGMDIQPSPPLPMLRTPRSFIHIRSFSR